MGVTLTFKRKSCCSSCLKGAVMGGFSWIRQHSHCGAAGPGSRVCQEGAARLHRQGQRQRQRQKLAAEYAAGRVV